MRTPGVLAALALLLGCSGILGGEPPPPPPAPVPVEAPAPVPPAPAPAAAAPSDEPEVAWPRMAWTRSDARTIPAASITSLAVAADGRDVWIASEGQVRAALGTVGVPAVEVAASGFDDTLYVVTHAGEWAIERWSTAGADVGDRVVLYRSPEPIGDLAVGVAKWNDAERVFFRRGEGSSARILSITRGGHRAYEVTAPDGTLGELTDPELRKPDPDGFPVNPIPLAAATAVPQAIDPGTGGLWWTDAAGEAHYRAYGQGNWGDDHPAGFRADAIRPSPNGWLVAVWRRGGPVEIHDPDGAIVETADVPATAAPAWTPDGRALVLATAEGVVIHPLRSPLAPIRYLTRARMDPAALTKRGLLVSDLDAEQLYQPYEQWAYDAEPAPTIATIDGLLEVLHAGFEAAFVQRERDVSIPKLRAFSEALGRTGFDRLAGISSVTLELLDGRADSDDAKAATTGSGGRSKLNPGVDVDWADFAPRGPYAHDEDLQRYFRAFKYVNLLRLTSDEQARLAKTPAVVDAWRAWVEVQAPFLQGSRYPGLLGTTSIGEPPWTRAACPPEDPRPLAYPLNWGLDSEAIDRTVAHDERPGCGVPTRGIPSGTDWLIALGSPWARGWAADEEARYPALATVHAESAAELGKPLTLDGVVPAWWRTIQLLATDAAVPEGADPDAWRGRLAETALASWVSLRHTMVLVNEATGAEMGDGGDPVFEILSLEPPTHAVDPVPAAWTQLAVTLTALAATRPDGDRVGDLLREVAGDSRDFADMARRQLAGQALTDAEYARIESFARSIEHPYLQLEAAAAGRDADGALVAPQPIQKIVDMHVWKEPGADPRYWHVAVGSPRELHVLAGDRGVLLPARGAVYSYFEVTADHRLDDDEWRTQLKEHPPAPPPWSPASSR